MLRRVRARARRDRLARARSTSCARVTQALWARRGAGRARAASSAICAPGGTSTATRSRRRSARRIEAMQAEARLALRRRQAGLGRGRRTARRVVRFRPRGSDAVETLRVARIVNCTGPELDIVRAGEPLLDALLAAGRIRPDPLPASASTSTATAARSAPTARPSRQPLRDRPDHPRHLLGERRRPRHPRPGRARGGAADAATVAA